MDLNDLVLAKLGEYEREKDDFCHLLDSKYCNTEARIIL